MQEKLSVTFNDPNHSIIKCHNRILTNVFYDTEVMPNGSVVTTKKHSKIASADLISQYKRQVKIGSSDRVVTYSADLGEAQHAITVDEPDRILVVYRLNPIFANKWAGKIKDGTYLQPQVYFAIKIDKTTGNKSYKALPSKWSIAGIPFPHADGNGIGTEFIYCCGGSYAYEMETLLKNDDLDMFVYMFINYITDGTKSGYAFSDGVEQYGMGASVGEWGMHIKTMQMADVAAMIYNDDENPFGLDTSQRKAYISCDTPEIQAKFLSLIHDIEELVI